MPIRVQDRDGTILEFPDGTDQQTMARAMRQRDQERAASHRAQAANPNLPSVSPGAPQQQRQDHPQFPSWRPRSTEDLIRGAPDTAYRRAYARREQEQSRRADFNRNGLLGSMDQAFRNMGVADDMSAGATWLGQSAENLVRRATGRRVQIPASIAAQAAGDWENDERARFARENPGWNNFAWAAGVPLTGGTPVTSAGRVGALRAGATAAAVNTPFALARQDGTLQERIPGAARETGVVFGLGAGLTAAGNAIGNTMASRAAQRAAQFDQAGVRAPLAAVQGRQGAPMAQAIAENPIGGNVRAHLQGAADDVAAAAGRVAQQYGQHGQPEQVGEVVQRGVSRFANERPAAPSAAAPETIPTRDWSFRAKADALYERAFGRILRDEAGHLAGQTGVRATATRTQAALASIQGRVSAPSVRELTSNPVVERFAAALGRDADALRFEDLRALRTWLREQRGVPGLTQTIDDASLARLEGALTEDIYASARSIGGEFAEQQLRRVDQFYRAGQNRIQRALAPFDPQRAGGRQAYDRVIALAREGGRQNTSQLRALRQSLRPDEWREVAATVVDDLGRVSRGSADALEPGAFSIERFVTNYAALSAEGRAALFGGNSSASLAAELDNLARVAGYIKGVRGFTNYSRSGSSIQNMSTLGAIGGSMAAAATGNPAPLFALLGAGLGARITGEMLTNPAFVRWLVSAPKGGAAAGIRLQLSGLAQLAARDPALVPIYTEVAQSLSGSPPPRTTQQQAPSEPWPAR